MSRKGGPKKAHGQVRRSQVITTWGPGALLDLPHDSVIVGGLEFWPNPSDLDEIDEPRLARKLQQMTGVGAPRLHAPPAAESDPREPIRGITVSRFPRWFVVQEGVSSRSAGASPRNVRSRRLVEYRRLDEKRCFEGFAVVPTRFVRACPRGHIDDLDWYRFVHGLDDGCRGQLWLEERGTSGDLADLVARCECGKQRSLYEASEIEQKPLGTCNGKRPWLGPRTREECSLPSRLLIRTAANAYFPHLVSTLSIPDRGGAVDRIVGELWDDLQIVDDGQLEILAALKRKPAVAQKLAPFSDEEVLRAIAERRRGGATETPVKPVELDALLAAPQGYGDDVPVDPNFHARKLPARTWHRGGQWRQIAAVIQVHRLREVMALAGFTRFEAITPDIQGEYESDVERAALAEEPSWFPAVENRGEGIFLQVHRSAVDRWLSRPGVKARLDALGRGHARWFESRRRKRPFPGGPYVLLHTLSHLLIHSLATRCGYPASSLRERVYADGEKGRYGVLLYTGSPDAEGTLGGLVQEARHIEAHLREALRLAALCSYDPICAQHAPGGVHDDRLLHGAACHGCVLVAETSCEMRNDYLDRALVVPTVETRDAAFFEDAR